MLTDLHWRCWGDDWALFDVGSGQTHRMDSFTATILMVVESGVVDLTHLLDTVAQELMLPNDPSLLTAVKANLEKLTIAGLIESSAT